MKSKLLAVVAAIAMLALTACGGGDSTDDSAKGASSDDTTTELKTGPGVTDTEIRVGLFSDWSGPLAEAASTGTLGTELVINEINDAGGICEREVVAVQLDTKYDPQVTTQVYRAESKNILMAPFLLGAVSIDAIKTNLARDKMIGMSASLNSATLATENVYVPMPLFEVELINGVTWAAEDAGATAEEPLKLGMVMPTDEYGKAYTEAVEFAADYLDNVEVVSAQTYTTSDQDFTAQVSALKADGADVVMLGTSSAQTPAIVGTAAQLGYEPTWIASSGAWLAYLAEPLKGLLDNFYVSAGYGTVDDDSEGINEMKAALAKYAPDVGPTQFMVGGWLMGKTAMAGLQAACDNGDLTREGVLEAMQDLKVSYGGITPEVDLGNGYTVPSFNSRVNAVNAEGGLEPLMDFYASEAAQEWGKDIGR